MLQSAIEELLGRYFFADGTLQKVGLFSRRGRVEIFASAPVMPDHPGYSGARMDSNYRQGRIYSREDWRDLKLTLGGVRECKADFKSEPLAEDLAHEMPYELAVDSFEISLLSPSEAALSCEAEDLSLNCRFQVLEYAESALREA